MHILAYTVLAIHAYTLEYRARLSFYLNKKQVEFQSSFKDFLADFPNGVIVLDTVGNLVFHNQLIADIILKLNTGSAAVPSKRTIITKEKLMEGLKDFVLKNGNVTLKEVAANWREGLKYSDNKFIYTFGGEKFSFLLKLTETIFQSTKCRVIILQDVTKYEKLEKYNETYKKMYVASIAHDIRTPLNGIIGMLDMMDDSGKTEEEKLYISVAKNTSKLLLFLTYDITDYSQMKADKFRANNSKTSIKETLNEVLQLFSFSFQRKNLKYSFTTDASVPDVVMIDKNRYIQILLNLIGNALKFTPSGSIKIEVSYDESIDMLATKVQDTGIGIRESDIPRLFKIFGKLEAASPLNPNGVGFGLAMCKKLAESLGGYIAVNSIPDLGTIFTFGIKANATNTLRLRSTRIGGSGNPEDWDSFAQDENLEEEKVELEKYVTSHKVRVELTLSRIISAMSRS